MNPSGSRARRPGNTARTRVHVIEDGTERIRRDSLATEEPLELRLVAGGERRVLAVTMRTPGHDFELAAGFLHGEGLLDGREAIEEISYCVDPDIDPEQLYNIVNVTLRGHRLPELPTMERHFTVNSSCGVCGKASLEALKIRGCPAMPEGPALSAETLYELPDALRGAQAVFDSTGGLHAAGLFRAGGTLVCLREDVGRHNAVDKVVGWALLNGSSKAADAIADTPPLHDHILMVSGRASFEIMQKAAMAGIPVVCAVSAPSSLAVSVAAEFGMTLIGFLRGRRFNVYAGAERVRLPVSAR